MLAQLAQRRLEAIRQSKRSSTDLTRYDWLSLRRENQTPPDWEWIVWLILAGRGFGKTRTGAETVRQWIREGNRFVNLIGATADDARDIMIEGESGLLACCPNDERPLYRRSSRSLLWPNGATSLIFTADEPERLRGKQHGKLWADELASWRYPESWDQAMFGLRLGARPQAVVTTTPRPTAIIKALAGDPTTALTRGSTYDNKANLAKPFLSKIVSKYEGTRLGRQELNAEILDDNPGALWKRDTIEAARVKEPPRLLRVVIAVDPAVSSNEGSDDTGVGAAGLGDDGEVYVLEDATVSMASPDEWGRAVVQCFDRHQADRIVAEKNQGGDLVESNIRAQRAYLPISLVHAKKGKALRAEPVAALYEQGKVHHVGVHHKLEDEMCEWNPTLPGQRSPNRIDWLVYAVTELLPEIALPIQQAPPPVLTYESPMNF